jgi:Phasin protein
MARQRKASAIGTGQSTGDETFANDELEGVESAGFDDSGDVPSRAEAIADESQDAAFAGNITDPVAVVVEAAVSPEFEILEEAGKEGAKAVEVAAGPLIARWREVLNESTSWSKEILDYSYAFGGEVLRAKSPAAAAEAQIDFARSTYLRLLDHLAKVSAIYLNFLRHACGIAQPGEAKAKD